MGGYIYLICDPANDTYKIGVTRDINSNRLKKLQTGNSTELHIVYIYKSTFIIIINSFVFTKIKRMKMFSPSFII